MNQSPISASAAASRATILVVEDGTGEREALARVLRMEGYDVVTARDVEAALPFLAKPVDMVVSDLRMGKHTGVELLQAWREKRPTTPFVIVTAYGDVESAVRAIKLGARDFITKPIDPERLLEIIRSSLNNSGTTPKSLDDQQPSVDRLLGISPAMRLVREQVSRAAAADSTVLILGESGTGKDLAAQAIHAHSRRHAAPLVTVNMAAVPEALVESELFGHVRGAFTGAGSERMGRFEAASGGTLFIDEVGDFPHHCQAKLLRVLEARVLQRIGGDAERSIDVRLVAATSRDLRQMVRNGAFRSDLFYRLNVVTIEIPPLRDRREDIPVLIEHYFRRIAAVLEKPVPQVAPDLLACLCNYDWPGNVRELRNCLESMIVLSQGERLTLGDLPSGILPSPPPGPIVEEESRLDSIEKSIILQTLGQYEGNRTRTAEQLGISVRTLQRRLKTWGVTAVEN